MILQSNSPSQMVLPLLALWFLLPDSYLPRHPSLLSHLPLPNTLLQPEHVSIYILGVQFNEDLSSVKNIFKSVQYLNKEYSIYYPAVLDDFDISSNVQLALDQNTIWYMSIKQYLAEALFF